MKTILMIGSLIVTIALVFYSLGFANERKRKLVTSRVILFFTIGVTLDITATTLMIIGSSRGMFTFHGIIGYSSLLGMVVDTIILWRHFLKVGPGHKVSQKIHLYSKIAYIWWIVAYISGGLLVAISKIK
jgi:hypothetical protein